MGKLKGIELPHLETWRVGKGMNRLDLAERSGISVSALRLIEHGGGTEPERVIRLARALGITVQELCEGCPDPDTLYLMRLRAAQSKASIRHRD